MDSGAGRVSALKKRFQELKDELEQKDDHCAKLEKELNEKTKLLKDNETELAAQTRKIQLLEEDLENINGRLTTATDMLEEASKGADESERSINALEKRGHIDSIRIEDLEASVNNYKKEALEWESKYVESARKCVMLEAELDKQEARNEENEARIKELESELDRATHNFKSLQVSIDQSCDKEDLYEQKIRLLKEQVDQLQAKYDDMNSLCRTTTLELEKAEEALAKKSQDYERLQYEYSSCLTELGDGF